MKLKLFETYNINIKKIRKKDGTLCNYAYIDPKTSTDDTMAIKDDIKNYGAKWNGYDKVWGWYLSDDKEKLQKQLDSFVYPAIEFLNSKETAPAEGPRTPEDMKADFQRILGLVDEMISAPMGVPDGVTPIMDEATVKAKLKDFKQELVDSMTNEAFLEKLEPIIRFRNANGHSLSFSNAILIWVQDRNAKLVKARGTWEKLYHRTVKPGSPALFVKVPVNSRYTKYASKEEKDAYKQDFLNKIGKNSVEELTAGEKDKLRVGLLALNQDSFQNFKFVASYYDVRFTEQIEGQSDEVGNWSGGTEDIPWSDETSEPTDLTMKMYDAMLEIIEEAGIKLSYSDDLGGAMGVSKNGAIEVLSNSNKNAGAVSTLIHEFSHELLHQKYLRDRGKDWCEFFVGTKQGRQVVEQQAELSAYLVMRFFGIKMQENINYVALWGADATKAANVFDTIANVANRIADKLASKMGLKSLNEEVGGGIITGLDAAEVLGPEAVAAYKKSKQMAMTAIKENFQTFFDRINQDLF